MAKKGPKSDYSHEKNLPRKKTKDLTKVKQRGELTRKGYLEVPNDNPNGKEDFDELLKRMVTPKK